MGMEWIGAALLYSIDRGQDFGLCKSLSAIYSTPLFEPSLNGGGSGKGGGVDRGVLSSH